MNVYTFLFRSKFFLFILLVLEAVDLDDPFGLSLSLHHSDFNKWMKFYVYCKFVSVLYAKTFTLTFCFYVIL